ncbi:c-type cytochrome [Polaromonas sp. A23]|uniref:c-type cytochrome n=1 Tax=Polaromonas sp. A23 TaxID=1944133 RepID=UPI000986EDC7|nr:c-type cytochrome [Polaromonas sp. A23]OOG37892.1 cytochrome C [Polaromonas sp. A23]
MFRSSCVQSVLILAIALSASAAHADGQAVTRYSGIGRPATSAEVKAWDIDVRPDFKGLPKGRGSVRQGEVVWESKCASCHGTFGESSDVFAPLAGGTTAEDIKTGRVANLMPGANQPQRTALMKMATLSTLWDYINRAMPWNAPKSLSTDEVYAATAYILNLGGIVPGDFTLSDANIRDVQERLPNRKGTTTAHAMWPGAEFGGTSKPDVQGSVCMRDCKKEVIVKSFLPDYARNAHGQLAEQTRLVGGTRGADTNRPEPEIFMSNKASPLIARAPVATEKIANAVSGSAPGAAVMPLLQKNACIGCHAMDGKLVGPSFKDVAGKYKGRVDAVNYLAGKIKGGGQGVWGSMPMPPQTLNEAEATQLAQWLAREFSP